MASKPKIPGNKRRGRHTTVIESARDVVGLASRLEIVTGIQVGLIDPHAKSRQPRLKMKSLPGGLEVQVLGSLAKQTIFLHTDDPESVGRHLQKLEIS